MKTHNKKSQILAYASTMTAFASVLTVFVALQSLEGSFTALIVATVVAAISAMNILILLHKTGVSNRSAITIHEITDNFQRAMIKARETNSVSEKMSIELNTLSVFCEQTRLYINSITRSDCRVFVKLLTNEDGQFYVSSLVSSGNNGIMEQTKLHLERNTVYYEALLGTKSHSYFYATDLSKVQGYMNETLGLKSVCRSVLVSPIKSGGQYAENEDVIGFLSIDSKKVDAFRSSELVQTIEYLSRQVWFFMSIVRTSYEAPANAEQIHSVDSLNARH